ncbi:molybdopterin-binding protein [Ramlibacter sp. 2FC]|uniref:competence/damage-inducible protein A n=1 Tax=Ramlibacter sp. 2FC TaxID=2502188 RepID=UPI0010F6EEDF|nr:molybdopterin-binding protein [Ramlibacter sp. 2FC]
MNPQPSPRPAPESAGSQPEAFGLIIIGDEILSGKRADKHLPKVIELLAARGLSLAWAEYVGDSPERITATLRRAFASGEVVFSCGGIGATPDDHTRQCAARALGVDLLLHPQAEALIRERMQDVAREQGLSYEPDRADNVHRLNMGVFPRGAQIIPNPYNKIPGFYCTASSAGPSQAARPPSGGSDSHEAGERGGTVYFVPGFPVMAWPMIEWVLEQQYAQHFSRGARVEKSIIVYGAMEATLTPLMESIEQQHAGVKVFSLPSVDHPQYGRHIELGVKGDPALVEPAYAALLIGLQAFDLKLGPELVR